MKQYDIKDWLPIFKVSAESDDELQSYFHKTPYLSSILEAEKWILLGRKGTGKTAIFEYLRKASRSQVKGNSIITLNFKDYSWPIHKLYKDGMEGELTAYQKSWQYLFIVQAIARLISTVEEKTGSLSGDLKTVKQILTRIYSNPYPSLLEVIKSKIFRLDKLSLPSVDIEGFSASLGEISFEEVAEDVKLKTKLKSNAFSLLEYFERVFLQYGTNANMMILLDQLDESWLSSELEEYSKILINLLNAAKSINNSENFKRKLRVVPFLRTDIYDTLNFNDKNKMYQDNAIEIRWDENSLNDMFYERITKYKPKALQLKTKGKSNCIFEVDFVRHGASPIKHIIRRSFLRPRDIIVYFNKINEIHKGNKSGLFTSKELYDAEKEYSSSMHDELLDEWVNQKPEFKEILVVLQNIGYQTFNYKTFSEKYALTFDEKKTPADVKETLRFLFRNSIVGQKVRAHWDYFCSNPNMVLDFEKEYYINSALKKRLNLTEGRA